MASSTKRLKQARSHPRSQKGWEGHTGNVTSTDTHTAGMEHYRPGTLSGTNYKGSPHTSAMPNGGIDRRQYSVFGKEDPRDEILRHLRGEMTMFERLGKAMAREEGLALASPSERTAGRSDRMAPIQSKDLLGEENGTPIYKVTQGAPRKKKQSSSAPIAISAELRAAILQKS